MDPNDLDWISKAAELTNPFADAVWVLLSRLGDALSELQARYPQLFSLQTLFGLIGTTVAIWKWWEGREANLFRKFEEMIARNEAQLVKARNDLLDVMIRPGPGLPIRPPLFVGSDLKRVLARRKWAPRSLIPVGQQLDRRLEQAIRTSERKVIAHLHRLSLFRAEIAAARLIQGAVASARAVQKAPLFRQQELDQEALDRFSEVLALPGHREDTTALELIAHQLARMDGPDAPQANAGNALTAVDAYRRLINVLQRQDETSARNVALARARRGLAVLLYPTAPIQALRELGEAVSSIMRLGPPRDRDLLELAELTYLQGLVHLRLNAYIRGPAQLRLARSYYRNLIRSLHSRGRGLFQWMFEHRKFSGHRVKELLRRAEEGRARTAHLLWLAGKRKKLLIKSLQRGRGVRRRNRKPFPTPKGRC